MSGNPDYDTSCEICGKPVGDHTLRGYAEELRKHGLDHNKPWVEAEGSFEGMDGPTAGAVTIMAAAASTALGKIPMLRFQFVGPGHGTTHPMEPIWLVMDTEGMRALTPLVASSVDRAILACSEGKS